MIYNKKEPKEIKWPMDELKLRNMPQQNPKTTKDLINLLKKLEKHENTDYGTAAVALGIAAEAAFNYMASKLGVTGFQASHGELVFLSRSRGIKEGLRLIKYDDLLYPQMMYRCDCSAAKLIEENLESLQKSAKELLENSPNAHPEVIAHWKKIIAMKPGDKWE